MGYGKALILVSNCSSCKRLALFYLAIAWRTLTEPSSQSFRCSFHSCSLRELRRAAWWSLRESRLKRRSRKEFSSWVLGTLVDWWSCPWQCLLAVKRRGGSDRQHRRQASVFVERRTAISDKQNGTTIGNGEWIAGVPNGGTNWYEWIQTANLGVKTSACTILPRVYMTRK